MKKTICKRLLSSVTALLVAASTVPTGLMGVTAAGDRPFADDPGAVGVNMRDPSKSISAVTLLVGEPTDESKDLIGDTVGETIQRYSDAYELGIASQFCVFVEEYFVPHNSDTEGRLAIGGYLDGRYLGNAYDVGKGDYRLGHEWSIQHNLSDFLGTKNFAHIIWGANTYEGERAYRDPKLSGIGYGYYKSGDEKKIAFHDHNDSKNKINSGYSQYYYSTEGALIDFDEQFAFLRERSDNIAAKENQFTLDTEHSFHLDWGKGGWKEDLSIVTLTYTGDASEAQETVYLNLDDPIYTNNVIDGVSWYEIIKTANVIRYENIPKLPRSREVAKMDGGTLTTETWDYSYIVINDSNTSPWIGWQTNMNWDPNSYIGQYTQIKGYGAEDAINISNFTIDYASDAGTWATYDKKSGPSGKYSVTPLTAYNNEVGVTSILYNFPKAEEVVIVSSAQGAILAPNAHITDAKYLKTNGDPAWDFVDNNNPHLSGSVAGKSFEGNVEFGFRTFTGPAEATQKDEQDVEYDIEVSKLDAVGGSLPGAKLAVYPIEYVETDDYTGNMPGNTAIAEWVSADEIHTVSGLAPGRYLLTEVATPDDTYAEAKNVFFEIIEGEEIQAVSTDGGKKLSGKNVTIKIYPDIQFAGPAQTYSYSPLEVECNNYYVGGDKYTIEHEGDVITALKKNGVDASDEIGDFKLYAASADDGSSGYILTHTAGGKEEVLIPNINLTSKLGGSFEIVNRKKLTIEKQDLDGKPLKGVQFALRGADGFADLSGVEVSGCSMFVRYGENQQGNYDGTNVPLAGSMTWKTEDAPVVISHLPDGRYYLDEVSAPNGYDMIAEPFVIVIENGIITSVTPGNGYEDYAIKNNDGTKISVYNAPVITSKVKVNKVWAGLTEADFNEGIILTYPSVTFTLKKGEDKVAEKTLDPIGCSELETADGQYVEFEDLPVYTYAYDNGKWVTTPIQYTLEETMSCDGFESSIDTPDKKWTFDLSETDPADDGKYISPKNAAEYTVTNTYTARTELKLKKVWEAETGRETAEAAARPAEDLTIAVHGKLDDGTEVYTGTAAIEYAEGASTWTGTAADLPMYYYDEDGVHEIVYTVDEPEVPENYTPNVELTGDGEFTITNTYSISEEVSLIVNKSWDNDEDDDPPANITVKVYGMAGDDWVYPAPDSKKSITITEDDDWTAELTGLAKYYNGIEIEYIVEEDIPDGYECDIDSEFDEDNNVYTYEILNTYTVDNSDDPDDDSDEDSGNDPANSSDKDSGNDPANSSDKDSGNDSSNSSDKDGGNDSANSSDNDSGPNDPQRPDGNGPGASTGEGDGDDGQNNSGGNNDTDVKGDEDDNNGDDKGNLGDKTEDGDKTDDGDKSDNVDKSDGGDKSDDGGSGGKNDESSGESGKDSDKEKKDKASNESKSQTNTSASASNSNPTTGSATSGASFMFALAAAIAVMSKKKK